MVNTIVANGITYDVSSQYLVENYATDTITGTGIEVPYYIAPMADLLADGAKNHRTTSASSVAIGTGAKTFVLAIDIPFVAGEKGFAIDTANPGTNYMYFTVTSYTAGTKTLVVSVASGDTSGSGTITSWSILGAAGTKGPAGVATIDINSLSGLSGAVVAADSFAIYDLSTTTNVKVPSSTVREYMAGAMVTPFGGLLLKGAVANVSAQPWLIHYGNTATITEMNAKIMTSGTADISLFVNGNLIATLTTVGTGGSVTTSFTTSSIPDGGVITYTVANTASAIDLFVHLSCTINQY